MQKLKNYSHPHPSTMLGIMFLPSSMLSNPPSTRLRLFRVLARESSDSAKPGCRARLADGVPNWGDLPYRMLNSHFHFNPTHIAVFQISTAGNEFACGPVCVRIFQTCDTIIIQLPFRPLKLGPFITIIYLITSKYTSSFISGIPPSYTLCLGHSSCCSGIRVLPEASEFLLGNDLYVKHCDLGIRAVAQASEFYLRHPSSLSGITSRLHLGHPSFAQASEFYLRHPSSCSGITSRLHLGHPSCCSGIRVLPQASEFLLGDNIQAAPWASELLLRHPSSTSGIRVLARE
ncbi:hypothetical protein SESBI_17197 [Sesbania bispinosa]|nr:hypothetical protein SESBI_17197 [Sesbania bispinosa]